MVNTEDVANPCDDAASVITGFLSAPGSGSGAGLVEKIMDYDGRTGVASMRYFHGSGVDELVAWQDVAGGVIQQLASDQLGSVVVQQVRWGAITETWRYSAYGEIVVGEETGQPFRFTGRRYDAETGLYYYRARYYSSVLGRFLQTDPIGYGDNMNLYAYVGNDPVNAKDPSGLCGTSSNISGRDNKSVPCRTSGTEVDGDELQKKKKKNPQPAFTIMSNQSPSLTQGPRSVADEDGFITVHFLATDIGPLPSNSNPVEFLTPDGIFKITATITTLESIGRAPGLRMEINAEVNAFVMSPVLPAPFGGDIQLQLPLASGRTREVDLHTGEKTLVRIHFIEGPATARRLQIRIKVRN